MGDVQDTSVAAAARRTDWGARKRGRGASVRRLEVPLGVWVRRKLERVAGCGTGHGVSLGVRCVAVGQLGSAGVRLKGSGGAGYVQCGGTSRGEGRGRCAPMVVLFGSLREGSCAHMVEASRRGTGFDGGPACVPVYTVVTGVMGQRWVSREGAGTGAVSGVRRGAGRIQQRPGRPWSGWAWVRRKGGPTCGGTGARRGVACRVGHC